MKDIKDMKANWVFDALHVLHGFCLREACF